MLSDLKPCPFCGGTKVSDAGTVHYSNKHEAFFADGTRITEAFYCNCMRCGISNRGLLGHQTKEIAIDKWNARADQQAEIDALREQLAAEQAFIRAMPKLIADFNFGSHDQAGQVSMSAAYAAVLNTYTAKDGLTYPVSGEALQSALAKAREEMRERCAKVCETIEPICYDTAGYVHCASAIRALPAAPEAAPEAEQKGGA